MKAFAVIVASFTGLSAIVSPVRIGGDGPAPVPTTTTEEPKVVYVPLQKPSVQATSVPVTTTTLPATECSEWYPIALSVGWTAELWPTLAKIMYRESRCIPSAFNDTDPFGGSLGLMQINMFWCKKHQGSNQGWLQSATIIADCQQLLDPAINLRAALAIYHYSEQRHERGWKPWGK